MKLTTRIPTHLNDGTPVDASTMQTIRVMIANEFGGVSVDGPGQGLWIAADGTPYDEPSYLVTFAASDRSSYAAARKLVMEIGRMLAQEAMYFEVQYFDGVEVFPVE